MNGQRGLGAARWRSLTVAGAMLAGPVLVGPAMADQPDFAAAGRKLFVEGVAGQVSCALCHALAHAGSTASVGPDLNDLRPDAARVEKAMREGLGAMPAFRWLSDEQISLLARYVDWAGKAD